jgi:hypothetical protein
MLPDSHLEKAGYLNGMQASGPKITGQKLPQASIF